MGLNQAGEAIGEFILIPEVGITEDPIMGTAGGTGDRDLDLGSEGGLAIGAFVHRGGGLPVGGEPREEEGDPIERER